MSLGELSPHPFLKWAGGKRHLLPQLLWAVQSAGSFRTYHEPFLGGGALFFALARSEILGDSRAVLSDVNPNLIDAYEGVRDGVEAVARALQRHKSNHSEEYFYEVRASTPETLSTRAARIIYLNKTCFNGLYRENSKGQFNAPFGKYKNPAICNEENLRAVSTALASADISAQPFTYIRDTAVEGDLVYFDPPYVPVSKTAQFTSYSAAGFGLREQEILARVVAELAARGVKVILSNSLTGLTRTLYGRFDMYRVEATRRINVRADRRGAVSEALVITYKAGCGRGKASSPQRAILVSGAARGIERMQAKQWLSENGYNDIAALIDEVETEWKSNGKQTRRNWWEILAGGTSGKSRVVAGRTFPVLRAAQIRQGVPITDNALERGTREEPPAVRVSGRWTSTKEGA